MERLLPHLSIGEHRGLSVEDLQQLLVELQLDHNDSLCVVVMVKEQLMARGGLEVPCESERIVCLVSLGEQQQALEYLVQFEHPTSTLQIEDSLVLDSDQLAPGQSDPISVLTKSI